MKYSRGRDGSRSRKGFMGMLNGLVYEKNEDGM